MTINNTLLAVSSSSVPSHHRTRVVANKAKSSSSNVPQRSNSSCDLKKSIGGRRSSDNASPSTIGSAMKKASSSSRAPRNVASMSKKSEKKVAVKAGFEAWSAARLTTSPVPSSAAPVFMPTVVAPVWQPVENILALVQQAEVSPRLAPDLAVTTSTSAPSSPLRGPRIPCPPGYEMDTSDALESLTATLTPPCTPVAVAAPAVMHDDFEIEDTHVSYVAPVVVSAPAPAPVAVAVAVAAVVPVVVATKMMVVPQQIDTVTVDPVSAPIVAVATYVGRTAALRTLIMALVALAALGAVLFTSSVNQMGVGAALPSVMLLAAFINRSSSSGASLFDDDVTMEEKTDNSSLMSSSNTIELSKSSSASSLSSSSRSSHKGNGRRSSRRHRTSA